MMKGSNVDEAAALLAKQPWTALLQWELTRILSPSPAAHLLSQVLLHPLTPSPMACRLFLSHPLLAQTSPSLSVALAASLARPSHLHALWPALRCLQDAPVLPLPHFFASLIGSLGHAGLPFHAKHLFFSMPLFSCTPTLSTCNALLRALLPRTSSMCQALALFEQMSSMGFQPNSVTYGIIWSRLCKLGHLQVVSLVLHMGWKLNTLMFNVLIHGLVKQGKLDMALHQVLQVMPALDCSPDTTIYNSLINGLLKVNQSNKALLVLSEMGEKGCSPDLYTFSVLINWSVKAGAIEAAMDLLQIMPSLGCRPDTITYTTLVDGLLKANKGGIALSILAQMARDGCSPNTVTCTGIMNWLVKERKVEAAMDLLQRMPSMWLEMDVAQTQ